MDESDRGSFEEGPEDILDSATRDRRWCQGNMQHFWLLFADNLHWGSKIHFVNGLFAYLGSCFWLLFLALSIALAFEWEKSDLSLIAVEGTSPLGYLSIFEHAVLLFCIILFLLLFPKVMSLLRIAFNGKQRRRHGGLPTLLAMGFGEVAVSTLLAPVLMVFHFRFVFLTLLGKGIGWASQNRGSAGLGWGPTLRALRLHTLVGLMILLISILIGPDFLLWLAPIWIGLLFSVPMGVYFSRPASGTVSRRFVRSCEDTREEHELGQTLAESDLGIGFFISTGSGFQNAVVDPIINAVHISILRESGEPAQASALPDKAFFQQDPATLDRETQLRILESPESMLDLHEAVWRLPQSELHPAWHKVLERYTLKPIFPG